MFPHKNQRNHYSDYSSALSATDGVIGLCYAFNPWVHTQAMTRKMRAVQHELPAMIQTTIKGFSSKNMEMRAGKVNSPRTPDTLVREAMVLVTGKNSSR